MEKTYKRVPFDLETAKKIQSGEIEGRIIVNKFADYILEVPEEMPKTQADLCEEAWLEDKNKHEFKPFDKVLVRGKCGKLWRPELFGAYNEKCGKYVCMCTYTISWEECIPYEGNEHLAFTTNNPE